MLINVLVALKELKKKYTLFKLTRLNKHPK